MYEEKAWRQLNKNIEQILEAALYKAVPLRPPTTHQEN